MAKRKKTKSGVEIKSTYGIAPAQKQVWWLAIIEKKCVRIFSYSPSSRELETVFFSEHPHYHDAVSNEIRDSAGRNQASFSWSRGGHQTSHPRHSYSSYLSPDEKASLHLFKKAATFLKGECKKDHFDALALIGHKHSLGEFKKLLDQRTQRKVTLQSTSFSNYASPKKQRRQMLAVVPEEAHPSPRWLPNQNFKKG